MKKIFSLASEIVKTKTRTVGLKVAKFEADVLLKSTEKMDEAEKSFDETAMIIEVAQ